MEVVSDGGGLLMEMVSMLNGDGGQLKRGGF